MGNRLKIAIAGITGSIGTSAVNIIRNHSDRFQIVLASAHSNARGLLDLAREFKIENLVITNGVKLSTNSENKKIYRGHEELYKLIQETDFDIFLNAMPGSNGLLTSYHVLKAGKKLALANKESLVLAGHILTKMAKANNQPILPVDSEHSAIFQALGNHTREEIRQLYITASGGAFRSLPLEDFSQIKYKDAIQHPVWDMGVKVTIDSATMMNKGLECIEAKWLFDIEYDQITPVIHPNSIVHSMVEFIDGSILAQLSNPSMELPILYALTYPGRIESTNVKTNIFDLPPLTFSEVDYNRYPLFKLALEVARTGGLHPTIMNAANEAALELFAKEEISFLDIHSKVEGALNHFQNIADPDLDTILEFNKRAFDYTLRNN